MHERERENDESFQGCVRIRDTFSLSETRSRPFQYKEERFLLLTHISIVSFNVLDGPVCFSRSTFSGSVKGLLFSLLRDMVTDGETLFLACLLELSRKKGRFVLGLLEMR